MLIIGEESISVVLLLMDEKPVTNQENAILALVTVDEYLPTAVNRSKLLHYGILLRVSFLDSSAERIVSTHALASCARAHGLGSTIFHEDEI